jgi:hypothetical protein
MAALRRSSLAGKRSAVGFTPVADAVDGEGFGGLLEENPMVANTKP